MDAIKIISQDLFDKIRSRFSNLEMGDDAGGVTIDPSNAYYFDFDFVIEGSNLGRVSISLGDLGSLKVYYSQGITENQDDPVKKQWYSFLREMRFFAMRRKLRFDTRDITKTNLDKNDFQHLAATQGPKEEPDMTTTMNESRWSEKSSRKTSRAVQGKTEVIVRHAHPVDETYAGARSQRKNIKGIFIQNCDGERFKYPFIHPAGAFAMAQHVDHGGTPHDPAGKAIIDMSEQIAKLGEFHRKINVAEMHPDAHGIAERAMAHLAELKNRVGMLSKRHHYQQWMSEFQEPQEPVMTELDAVTMEDYKSKFTQTSFQEELSGYFPLLHRIMGEANTVDLEEYVSEQDIDEATALQKFRDNPRFNQNEPAKDDPPFEPGTKSNFSKPNNPNRTGMDAARALAQRGMSPAESINSFEEWAEATASGEIDDNQVKDLADAIAKLPTGDNGKPELKLGQDGSEAIMFFSNYGLDNMDLKTKLKNAANGDENADPFQVLKSWAVDDKNYPELMQRIGMTDDEQPPEQDPAADPNAAPADPNAAPADPAAAPPEEGEEDAGEEPEQPQGTMFEEIAKIVSGRFNKDNKQLGAFNGETNIALEVKKEIAEKFGDEAGEMSEQLALKFMEKLSADRDHGPVGGDGLARMKEIMRHMGVKVEGMGEEKDNWHPSKHVTDPQKQKELAPYDKHVDRGDYNARARYLDAAGVKRDQEQHEDGPKASEIPAWKRKEQGKAPLTTQDLDNERDQSRTTQKGLDAHAAKIGVGQKHQHRQQQQENAELETILRLSNFKK